MLLTLLCSSSLPSKDQPWKACLPSDVNADEIVTVEQTKSSGGSQVKVTVGETLTKLKARCKRGKLVDAAGKEIRFFHLIGCWGNPPEDYQEQLDKQSRELKNLKKKYTVIEIQCGVDPRTVL
jgi:hypothetical protein